MGGANMPPPGNNRDNIVNIFVIIAHYLLCWYHINIPAPFKCFRWPPATALAPQSHLVHLTRLCFPLSWLFSPQVNLKYFLLRFQLLSASIPHALSCHIPQKIDVFILALYWLIKFPPALLFCLVLWLMWRSTRRREVRIEHFSWIPSLDEHHSGNTSHKKNRFLSGIAQIISPPPSP